MFYKYFIFGYLVTNPILGFAKKPATTEPIDKVLDMLEKKMIEQDNFGTGANVTNLVPEDKSQLISNKLKFSNPYKIEGNPEEHKILDNIKQNLAILDQRVDQISTDISSLKQSLIVNSKNDAYVEISARVGQNSTAQLRSIQVKLNSTILYDVSDSSLLWSYNTDIPIYFGPLKPGSHRLQLQAKLALPNDESLLKITSNRNIEVNNVFDIHIPLGTTQNKFVIELETPEKHKATARLLEPN
jgi:hypothetical protein